MQNYSPSVAITIAAISIILLFLGVLFIMMLLYYRNKRQQTAKEKEMMEQAFNELLLQSQIETQEETFSALGKELHDNIGQLLNSTKLLIGITQRKLDHSPDTLAVADETLGTAIHELRSLSKSLNKEWLQQFNLIENLQTEIKRINANDDLQIHFVPTLNLPFKSDEQIVLFRVVQESLQNAIKHAKAKNIYIEMSEGSSPLFTINISDDGCGFIASQLPKSGVGIINMKHRINLMKGNIQWQSLPTGTTVSIQLPVQPIYE